MQQCWSLELLARKYGTDKYTHGFAATYDKAFSSQRDQFSRVTEIGVFFGASILMWRDYFPHATIFGLDTFEGKQGNGNAFVNSDQFWLSQNNNPHPRIKLSKVDQSKRSDLKKWASQQEPVSMDIIVDDGSHLMYDQQISWEILWPLVRPGGYFIIEDLHSSLASDYDVLPDKSNSTLRLLETRTVSPYWEDASIFDFVDTIDIVRNHNNTSITGLIRKKMFFPALPKEIPGTLIISYAAGSPLFQACQVAQREWWHTKNQSVIAFGSRDLDPNFQSLLTARKGAGYWLWKPYIIWAALSTGIEYVFYCDSGSLPLETIDSARKRAEQHQLAGYELGYVQGAWTKKDVLDQFSPASRTQYQRAATAMMLRNTPAIRNFVQEWLDLCQISWMLNDSPSRQAELPEFQEHRHDQALFSLLTYKFDLGHFVAFHENIYQGFWKHRINEANLASHCKVTYSRADLPDFANTAKRQLQTVHFAHLNHLEYVEPDQACSDAHVLHSSELDYFWHFAVTNQIITRDYLAKYLSTNIDDQKNQDYALVLHRTDCIPDHIYCNIIDVIQKTHPLLSKIQVLVESNQSLFDETPYRTRNVDIVKCAGPLPILNIMSHASIIVVFGNSVLDYVAGLCNKNATAVYYIPHVHPPLSHWTLISGIMLNKKPFLAKHQIIVDVMYDVVNNQFSWPENSLAKTQFIVRQLC